MHSEPDIGGYLCTHKPVHWVTNHKVHLIDIVLQSRVKVLLKKYELIVVVR